MTFFPIFMIAWKKLPLNGCSFIIEFAFLCWFSLYRTNYVDQPKCMQKKSWKWQSIFRLLLSVNFESFVNYLAYKLKNSGIQEIPLLFSSSITGKKFSCKPWSFFTVIKRRTSYNIDRMGMGVACNFLHHLQFCCQFHPRLPFGNCFGMPV